METRNKDLEEKLIDQISENLDLKDYIKNRFDKYIGRDQEQLRHEQEVFNTEKKAFTTYAENKQLDSNALSSEIEQKLETLDIHENTVAEREEEI